MNELNEFLKAVANEKTKDPKHQLINKVKQSVASDIGSLLEQLTSISNRSECNKEYTNNIEQLAEEVHVVENIQALTEETSNVAADFVEQMAGAMPKQSFQQPELPKINPELKTITEKLKFLEQWVSKISSAGPGSGEVNFRWLDDVNRSSMNDNWVLEYDATSKKVQFTENVGPVRTVKFNTEGPLSDLVAGQVAYNSDEDCLDIKHADGSTLQTGLEQHMQVYNHGHPTLPNGTVVRFAGVNGDGDETPIIEPHIADGTVIPLFTVGVLTNNIPSNTIGRATTYGKVRNLNTTGSDVGETWQTGDILYVSPTNAGKLTRVKPTAPNIVVVVAAVLKVHATEGVLLVRPTIFPRLYYGSFSDTTDQTALAINTPYAVKYNTTDIANGHQITNDSHVVALNSGLYNYQFSLQLSSSSSSQKQVYVWARKNGIDIPNSATRLTIAGNGYYAVAAWNFIISMNAADYFQLMWAVDDIGAKIDAPPATAFCPSVPSVILTVTEAAL